MSLSGIISGRKKQPFNIWIYGHAGLGKSTFGSKASAPIFWGAENNDEVEADKFPIPENFEQAMNQLKRLLTEKHQYETIVVDSLDSIEKLIHRQILKDAKAQTMAAAFGGFGKAYERAEVMMTEVRDILGELRNRGLNIIITSHVKKKTAIDPVLGMGYDSFEPNVHDRILNLIGDWVSAILFVTSVTYEKKDVNSDKVFAHTSDERVVYTERRAGFIAKNRYNLPYEMPLDFSQFYQGYLGFYHGKDVSIDEIKMRIEGLLENIVDEEKKAKIRQVLSDAKEDEKQIRKIYERVKTIVGS